MARADAQPADRGAELSVEPTLIDEHGQPVAGGPTYTETYRTSVPLGQGRPAKPAKKDGDAGGRPGDPTRSDRERIKLEFTLGPDGRVTGWSLDGPRKRG